MNTKNFGATLLLMLAMVVVGVMSFMQSGLISDDVFYYCIWRPNATDDFVAINSVADVVRSQAVHYEHVNGRLPVHFAAQLFFGLLGKTSFAIINALVFGFCIYLVSRFICGKQLCTGVLVAVLFTFTLMFPSFVDCYVWLLGAVNYLWAAMLAVLFLLVFRSAFERVPTVRDWVLAPLFLLAGWTHEAIALPLALGTLTYCVWHWRKVQRRAVRLYVFWFLLGALLCVASPGIIHRAAGESVAYMSVLQGKFIAFAINLLQLKVFWLLLALILWLWVKRRKELLAYLQERAYLCFTLFFAFGAVAVGGVTQSRACFGVELYALLLLFPLIRESGLLVAVRSKVQPLFVMLTLLSLGTGLVYARENYRNYCFIKEQLDSGEKMIKVRPELRKTYLGRYYARIPVVFAPGTNNYDEEDENVRGVAFLCQSSGIYFLPEDVADTIAANPNAYWEYGESCLADFMVKQLPDTAEIKGITFILGEDNPPLYKRPFMYKADEYEAPRWAVHNIDGRRYVFFDKPVPKISRRIKDVLIH